VGVRLVAVDRPGTGMSGPRPRFGLEDVGRDVVAVLDELRVDRFAVAGLSWGGPYAAALAVRYPDRVSRLGLVSAMGGWLTGAGAARDAGPSFAAVARMSRFPAAMRVALRASAWRFGRNPEAAVASIRDAEARQPAVRDMLVAKTREAVCGGIAGQVDDTLAVVHPWPFSLGDVKVPTTVWWGDADTEITEAMARRTAAEIPDARLVVVPGAGHLLYLRVWEEILTTLTPHP
jgi:pimeloyl-ACP methyl ester carboxylesterase